jgi:D-alanine-D-alanine ligase
VSARIRIAVLAGGRSSEHDVSLRSAASVVEALDPERYEVRTIEIGRDGRWALAAGGGRDALGGAVGSGASTADLEPAGPSAIGPLGVVDVVVPILHGPFGEDGTVQGALELMDVPYVGAGVLASALCMDKDRFKAVMRDAGIPVTPNITLRLGDAITNPYGYPVFVKPARLGSSVGISKVEREEDLVAAVELARRHDEKVLVEQFVQGTEVEVAVLGNLPTPEASLPGEVVAHHADWYDWSSKYAEGGSDLVVPPPGLSETQIELLQRRAVEAFVATECEGMARADFFVRKSDGEVVMNELNTIPGFTRTSFYARLFEESGIPYPALLDRLIELALERYERRRGLEY